METFMWKQGNRDTELCNPMFIEKKLKLKVNREKSAVDRPWEQKFLWFSFTSHKEPKIRIAKQSLVRVKQRIRMLTSRRKSIATEERLEKLNQYLMGWCGYFALAETPSIFQRFDEWIRWRLRICIWKQWMKPRTKIKKLISLEVPKDKAYKWGNTRKL